MVIITNKQSFLQCGAFSNKLTVGCCRRLSGPLWSLWADAGQSHASWLRCWRCTAAAQPGPLCRPDPEQCYSCLSVLRCRSAAQTWSCCQETDRRWVRERKCRHGNIWSVWAIRRHPNTHYLFMICLWINQVAFLHKNIIQSPIVKPINITFCWVKSWKWSIHIKNVESQSEFLLLSFVHQENKNNKI